jgi:hypothetical protein
MFAPPPHFSLLFFSVLLFASDALSAPKRPVHFGRDNAYREVIGTLR